VTLFVCVFMSEADGSSSDWADYQNRMERKMVRKYITLCSAFIVVLQFLIILYIDDHSVLSYYYKTVLSGPPLKMVVRLRSFSASCVVSGTQHV